MSTTKRRAARLIAAGAAVGLCAALAPLVVAPAFAATTWFVDANSASCPGDGTVGDPFCTIQEGVDASVAGDTVEVADGTYNELVVVDEEITLNGAEAGNDARTGRPSGAESVIDGTGLGGALQITAENVVVDGFHIMNVADEGAGLLACVHANGANSAVIQNNVVETCVIGMSPGGTGIEITQNLIRDITNSGSASGTHIYTDFATTNLNIHDNLFFGVLNDGSTGVNLAATAANTHTDPVIKANEFSTMDSAVVGLGTDGLLVEGNEISGYVGSGVYLGDFGSGWTNNDPTVKGNTFNVDADNLRAGFPVRRAIAIISVDGAVKVENNTLDTTSVFPGANGSDGNYGILLGEGPNGDTIGTPDSIAITGNTLDGGDADTANGTDDSHGIKFESGFPAAVPTDVTCNVLTGWVDGISAELVTGTDVDANNNDIVRNGSNGASNTGAELLNAEGNWWGAPSGPGPVGAGDDIFGNVDADPFRIAPSSCAPGTPPVLPGISINNTSVPEGDSGSNAHTFTVTLSAASPETVTVDYFTQNGTATAPSDYDPAAGTVTFDPGETSKLVSFDAFGDTLDEPNETFRVRLTNPKHARITDNLGVGTIIDDDSNVGIRVRDANVTEGDSGTRNLNFRVTLNKVSGFTVTVKFITANGSAVAPSDYTTKSGTVTFAPGEKSKTVQVKVKGDTANEPNESMFLLINTPTNATIIDPNASGGIIDDD